MANLFKLIGFLCAILCVGSAYAGDVEIIRAWGHATAPGQESESLDLHMISKQGASLIRATTPVATSVEIHVMFDDKGVMKMREVKSVELPAGKVVDLSLINHHLMLIGLKSPLKSTETIPLSLTFKLANNELLTVETIAHIRAERHHHHIVTDTK